MEPPRATGWGAHVRALRDQGRQEEALAYLAGAHQAGADYAGLWQTMSAVLVKLSRFDAALEAADTAVARDPDDALSHTVRATALACLDRYPEASQAAERALALDSDQAIAWGIKGDSLLRVGRLDEALAATERATTLDPSNGDIWRIQGNVLSALRRDQDALVSYDRAVGILPANLGALIGKANIHMRLREYAPALAAFERAEEAGARDDALVVLNMAQAQFGLVHLEAALLDDAADPTAAWTLTGRCLYGLKRYEEALTAFEQALMRHPEVAQVRERVGRTQLKLGRYRAALATLFQAALGAAHHAVF